MAARRKSKRKAPKRKLRAKRGKPTMHLVLKRIGTDSGHEAEIRIGKKVYTTHHLLSREDFSASTAIIPFNPKAK